MSDSAPTLTPPSIVFLNGLGHIEISWSARHEYRMKALIEKKMAAGVRFFILKPRLLGLFRRPVLVSKVNDIGHTVLIDDDAAKDFGFEAKEIRIHDPDLAELARLNAISFTRRDETSSESIGYAKTVADVLTNRTVAAPRLVGG